MVAVRHTFGRIACLRDVLDEALKRVKKKKLSSFIHTMLRIDIKIRQNE